MSDYQMRAGPVLERALFLACLLPLAAALAGCGLAGVDDAASGGLSSYGGTSALRITTTDVPAGSPGVGYEATLLDAAGATGAMSWQVVAGALPSGLRLTQGGLLLGTPLEAGYFPFTAQVEDGLGSDRQDLAISIDTFGLLVSDGLAFGDAWSGVPVTLRCAGFVDGVAFEVVANGSRGSLHQVDPDAGSAVWVPGPVDAAGVQDVIRARCDGTGSSAEVVLDVAPDRTAGHTAQHLGTDVWYVDFEIKTGVHPYASDWHAALARLGLRGAQSTDRLGTEADRLADLVTRLAALRHLNRVFLREEDGTAGAQGLAISFPLERPGAGYGAPLPGASVVAQPGAYSVMAVCDQRSSVSAYGTALGDGVGNGRVENNSPGPGGDLGTFVRLIAESVRNVYRLHGDALRASPVSAADVPELKALLYGGAAAGDRRELLRYFAEALGQSVAYICAHEIGHSLGLHHTASYVSGSIMNSTGVIAPGLPHAFLPEDVEKLRLGLPGPGRGAGAAPLAAELDQVHVCTTCGN